MLMTLVDWFQGRPEVEFARLTFRPNNPGTNRLFGRVPSRVPPGRASLTVYDYFVMPLRRQAAASAGSDRTHFNIVRAAHVDADRVDAFYRGCLPDAQRHSLSLCAPDLTGLDAKYREAGLRRYRAIFVAERHGAILGSAICNVASEGINFSFLENALEAVEVDASLAESEARAVFHGLICTAVEFYRELGRDYLVALINPKYAQFRQDLAINGATSKQYAVLTVDQADGSFSLSQAYFLEYYRALLGKGSIGEVAWQ
jgi:hypothetical protein